MDNKILLTEDQKRALDQVISFMLNPEQKEIIISGSAGAGKTFLISWFQQYGIREYLDMCHLIGKEPEFKDLKITATTNKAAEVLATMVQGEVTTIHSLLSLIVKPDYKTGATKLVVADPEDILADTILFIDECSMVDGELKKFIDHRTFRCKIIYVGDEYQLSPVKSQYRLFADTRIPIIRLNQQVRFNPHSAIPLLAQQLRDNVGTKKFDPLFTYKNQIIHATKDQAKQMVDRLFKFPNNSARIVTYTNKKSIAYNEYIKYELRQQTEPFNIGDRLIAGNPYFVAINTTVGNTNGVRGVHFSSKIAIHTDDEVEVVGVGDIQTEDLQSFGSSITFKYQYLDVVTRSAKRNTLIKNVAVVLEPEKYTRALKFLAGKGEWHTYYTYKDNLADLRPKDSCTIHKAQGSTVDTVFVDLTDLGTCRNPDTVARLLYVACTRARNKVVLYGELPKKYGGQTYELNQIL